jgi:hypothetical protein
MKPTVRVPPAQQGLDADRPPGRELELRLVVQHQARVGRPVGHRVAQIVDGLQPLAGRIRVAGAEDGDRFTELLGLVHRDVGLAHEAVHLEGVLWAGGDADAALDVDAHLVELERQPQRRERPVRNLQGLLSVGPGQDNGELVAAQPREQVVLAQDRQGSRSDLRQQGVPVVVAQRVVDLLKPVEIQDQQRAPP